MQRADPLLASLNAPDAHDVAHAYVVLAGRLDAAPAPDAVRALHAAIARDVSYALDHARWARHSCANVKLDSPAERMLLTDGALACFYALRAASALCAVLPPGDETACALLKDACTLVGADALYYNERSIRLQAAATVRACFARHARAPGMYDAYGGMLASVLQASDTDADDALQHACLKSLLPVLDAHPLSVLSALSHIPALLFPLLSSAPSMRTHATRALAAFARALPHAVPALQKHLAIAARDFLKAAAARKPDLHAPTLYNALRAAAHQRADYVWALQSVGPLIALLGRRLWFLPGAMRMLTLPLRAGAHEIQEVDEEDRSDGGIKIKEQAHAVRLLLVHALARLRLWQQAEAQDVHADGASVANFALKEIIGLPRVPAALVPALLTALGDAAGEGDVEWAVAAALRALGRVIEDGEAEVGGAMLLRLVGGGDEVEMGPTEDGEDEEARREVLLARLVRPAALGADDAQALPEPGAADVRALPADVAARHWRALLDCWTTLVRNAPDSSSIELVFAALLALPDATAHLAHALAALSTPSGGDEPPRALLVRLWAAAGPRALDALCALEPGPACDAAWMPAAAAACAAGSVWAGEWGWRAALEFLHAAPVAYRRGEAEYIAVLEHLVRSAVGAPDAWAAIEEAVGALDDGAAPLGLAGALARGLPLGVAPACAALVGGTLGAAYARADVGGALPVLDALCAGIQTHGLDMAAALALVPGLSTWIADTAYLLPDALYNTHAIPALSAFLCALPTTSLSVPALHALSPLLAGALERLPPPGAAEPLLWTFFERVQEVLRAGEMPGEAQAVLGALYLGRGMHVPEGLLTQPLSPLRRTPRRSASVPAQASPAARTQRARAGSMEPSLQSPAAPLSLAGGAWARAQPALAEGSSGSDSARYWGALGESPVRYSQLAQAAGSPWAGRRTALGVDSTASGALSAWPYTPPSARAETSAGELRGDVQDDTSDEDLRDGDGDTAMRIEEEDEDEDEDASEYAAEDADDEGDTAMRLESSSPEHDQPGPAEDTELDPFNLAEDDESAPATPTGTGRMGALRQAVGVLAAYLGAPPADEDEAEEVRGMLDELGRRRERWEAMLEE